MTFSLQISVKAGDSKVRFFARTVNTYKGVAKTKTNGEMVTGKNGAILGIFKGTDTNGVEYHFEKWLPAFKRTSLSEISAGYEFAENEIFDKYTKNLL